MKPSGHVPNHAGDLSRATGHLRAAVAKRRGRPPAAPFLLQLYPQIVRLTYVMDYSFGTQAHMIRTRRLRARLSAHLEKVFGARSHPATITYNAKAPELAARQRVLFCDMMNWDP